MPRRRAARPAALAVRRRHAVRAQYRRRRRWRNRRHGRSQQDATAGLRRARRLSLADAHQAGRRGAGARPRHRQDAGLDRILELRRQLPDRAPSRGVSLPRPAQRLRVRQHDPGRQERADLWHPHADSGARDARPDLGTGQPDLPRRIRRPADEPAREHRGDHRHRRRRAHRDLPRRAPGFPAPMGKRMSPLSSRARPARARRR